MDPLATVEEGGDEGGEEVAENHPPSLGAGYTPGEAAAAAGDARLLVGADAAAETVSVAVPKGAGGAAMFAFAIVADFG